MRNPILLETERLILRSFVPSDIDDLHAQISDPEVMRYYPKVSTREDSEKWLEVILRDYQTHGFGMLAVCLKETGEFVGQAGVMRRQTDTGEHHYLAYLIRKNLWGRGYATEAARKVVDNVFGNLGVRKIEAFVRPDNTASVRLAEKLGMKLESTTEHMGCEHQVYILTRPWILNQVQDDGWASVPVTAVRDEGSACVPMTTSRTKTARRSADAAGSGRKTRTR